MKYGLFIFLFLFSFFNAFSQSFNSGDPALDESLNSLTEQVKDNPQPFIETNLALRFNQSKEVLLDLLKKDKMEVSEIFLISYLSAKNKIELIDFIKIVKDKKRDWQSILKDMNIIKGNKDYRSLLKASINIHPKPFFPKIK